MSIIAGRKEFQETYWLLSASLYLLRSMPGNGRPRFSSIRINRATSHQEEGLWWSQAGGRDRHGQNNPGTRQMQIGSVYTDRIRI